MVKNNQQRSLDGVRLNIVELPYHLIGVCLLLATITNEEFLLIPLGNFSVAPFDLAFIFFILSTIFSIAIRKKVRIAQTINAQVILYCFALLIISFSLVISSNDLSDKLRDIRVILYFTLPPLLVLRLHPRLAYINILIDWIIISGAFVAITMCASAFFFTTELLGRNIRLGVWLLPFSIISAIKLKRSLLRNRVCRFTYVALLVFAILISQNRSQYLQLLLSLALLVWYSKSDTFLRTNLYQLAAIVLISFAALWSIDRVDILFERLLTLSSLEEDSSIDSRYLETAGQIDDFISRPYFGHGIGWRSLVMGPNGYELSTFAHNSWLFYLMKFGIVFSIIIIAPIFLNIYRGCFSKDSMQSTFYIATMPAFFLIDSMSAGLAYAPKSIVVGFFLVYGIIITYGTNDKQNRLYTTQPKKRWSHSNRKQSCS